MKKNNILKLLGIALIVTIVSTGIFYGLFVGKLTSSQGTEKTLVVAAKALKVGTQLQATDLRTIPWPAQQPLPEGFYGSADQVAGNTVFDPIGEGEPVTASRLATSKSGGGGSGVPAGMRAVSVHVTDSTGVLALLRSGQKVDAQVVIKAKDAGAEVRTALEDLSVLSVTPQAEMSSQGFNLPVVTLLANPAEADILAAADSGARVRLTLRNPLDGSTRVRAPLTVDAVMRTSGTASPESGSATAPGASHETAAVQKPAPNKP